MRGPLGACRLGAQHICHHGAAVDVPPAALLRHTVGRGLELGQDAFASSADSRLTLTLSTVACRSNKTKKVKTPGEALLGSSCHEAVHFAHFLQSACAAC